MKQFFFFRKSHKGRLVMEYKTMSKIQTWQRGLVANTIHYWVSIVQLLLNLWRSEFSILRRNKTIKDKNVQSRKGLCLSRTVSYLLNHMKSVLTQVGLIYVCSRNYCFTMSIHFEIFPRTFFLVWYHSKMTSNVHQWVVSVTYTFT